MNGKCPGCGKLVLSVRITEVEATASANRWNAITFMCPLCNVVLGCQIDPIALRTDIVTMTTEAVIEAMGR